MNVRALGQLLSYALTRFVLDSHRWLEYGKPKAHGGLVQKIRAVPPLLETDWKIAQFACAFDGGQPADHTDRRGTVCARSPSREMYRYCKTWFSHAFSGWFWRISVDLGTFLRKTGFQQRKLAERINFRFHFWIRQWRLRTTAMEVHSYVNPTYLYGIIGNAGVGFSWFETPHSFKIWGKVTIDHDVDANLAKRPCTAKSPYRQWWESTTLSNK
jgi:hypothetical protein